MVVIQRIGACSASDIAGFISACDSVTATSAQCDAWLQAAPPTCVACLGMSDAGAPENSGGLWFDWQGDLIGANVPGCDAIVDGNQGCAIAYNAAVQCVYAAGCETCTSQTQAADMCQQQVLGSGGACYDYVQPAITVCMTDFGDGGALNNGVCSTDTQVISVICGNGSGDGG
jgi:hypothetical protein